MSKQPVDTWKEVQDHLSMELQIKNNNEQSSDMKERWHHHGLNIILLRFNSPMPWCQEVQPLKVSRLWGSYPPSLVGAVNWAPPLLSWTGSPFPLSCHDLRQHGFLPRNSSDVAAWSCVWTINPNRSLFLITYPAFCYSNTKQIRQTSNTAGGDRKWHSHSRRKLSCFLPT